MYIMEREREAYYYVVPHIFVCNILINISIKIDTIYYATKNLKP